MPFPDDLDKEFQRLQNLFEFRGFKDFQEDDLFGVVYAIIPRYRKHSKDKSHDYFYAGTIEEYKRYQELKFKRHDEGLGNLVLC